MCSTTPPEYKYLEKRLPVAQRCERVRFYQFLPAFYSKDLLGQRRCNWYLGYIRPFVPSLSHPGILNTLVSLLFIRLDVMDDRHDDPLTLSSISGFSQLSPHRWEDSAIATSPPVVSRFPRSPLVLVMSSVYYVPTNVLDRPHPLKQFGPGCVFLWVEVPNTGVPCSQRVNFILLPSLNISIITTLQ